MIAKKQLKLTALYLSLSLPLYAMATEHTATLAGHAILPAQSFIPAPKDAPQVLQHAGKFTTSERVEKLGSVEGTSDKRPTGVALPFNGQPLQGHSGIKKMSDGSYWLLTDNGAGSKANSPDFMLYLSRYNIDFNNHKFEPLETIFLHDPDKKVPFYIVHESTEQRYLTGADFDPESFQIIDDNIWIGEEFGPYLIQTDLKGKVLNVFQTEVDGKVVHSPDHYRLKTQATPTEKISFEVKRSKGFEGMAASIDGSKLYPLLEGPLWDNTANHYENNNNQEYLRILEFDIADKKWTGHFWQYPLEKNGNAIGDFNMIDENRALVIERDNGEGVREYACQDKSADSTTCFSNLPEFKRVYLIKFDRSNVGQSVEKLGYIDLLNIQDPNKIAQKPLSEGVFKFPFFTIENVDLVDDKHIIVGNDNNLPYSSSREPNKADDNELILLNVESLLQLK
ncbi:esterase-like activity of phytase family protein [Conservatibacter flavescens]|uniref:Glycerophosphodiester phosphodiesterase n=1 Tax=Conservatibacter flavescens TaxID=28161 RepID=A0A2M8S2Y9_9PAST|nr:esterase-like activity of phytase family protein [Conservatibacter flavescens]PJG85509.1 glycerophosphodiester phosphodiesterase [Conservatibacter flavescens]